jgi:hypothetical protein
MKFLMFSFALFCLSANFVLAQINPNAPIMPIKGAELLTKTIQYHDPKGNWSKLHTKLYFHAKEPKDTNIREEVLLDNRGTYFGHIARVDGKLIEKGIIDTTPYSRINGDTVISEDDRKKYRLSARAIRSARNSYVFLYGLPMKLRDKGVILNDTVRQDTFNQKTYWVLNARFEKGVGGDTWYLYINPKTFALEGYRFYHNRKPNDGEFIICEDLIVVQHIKIPRIRYWHANENGAYIATDIVVKSEKWAWQGAK